MANDGLPQLQAFRLRVARLDPLTGEPLAGASNGYVSGALITLTPTLVYEDGEETVQRNGEGLVCLSFRGPDTFRRVDWTMSLCTPDPYLVELLTSGTVLTDTGAIGYAVPALGPHDPDPVSIEVWTKRVNNERLDETYPYARWVLPWNRRIRQNTPGEFGSGAMLPEIVGESIENPNWGTGPFADWPGTVATDRALFWLPREADDVPDPSTAYVAVT